MEKTLETVRLELEDYFGNGKNFYECGKEFDIFNTSITRTDNTVRLMNNYVCYNSCETDLDDVFTDDLYNELFRYSHTRQI